MSGGRARCRCSGASWHRRRFSVGPGPVPVGAEGGLGCCGVPRGVGWNLPRCRSLGVRCARGLTGGALGARGSVVSGRPLAKRSSRHTSGPRRGLRALRPGWRGCHGLVPAHPRACSCHNRPGHRDHPAFVVPCSRRTLSTHQRLFFHSIYSMALLPQLLPSRIYGHDLRVHSSYFPAPFPQSLRAQVSTQ